MKALIVEDERIAADRLEKLIKACNADIEILDKLETIRGVINWLESNPLPELLFLDIQLADGLSFEIFQKVKINVPVIFTTSYDQYAIQAFKTHSIDYLLKPIDKDDLERALHKFEEMKKSFSGTHTSSMDEKVIQKLYKTLTNKPYKDRFVIKIGEHIKTVFSEDIMFFESKDKTTFMKHTDGRKYIIDHTLDQLSDLLDPKVFFRINRQFIISIHSIEDIISWSNSRLKVHLKDEKTMDAVVAREKVGVFKKWLEGEIKDNR